MFIELQFLLTFCIDRIIGMNFSIPETVIFTISKKINNNKYLRNHSTWTTFHKNCAQGVIQRNFFQELEGLNEGLVAGLRPIHN